MEKNLGRRCALPDSDPLQVDRKRGCGVLSREIGKFLERRIKKQGQLELLNNRGEGRHPYVFGKKNTRGAKKALST